MGMTYLTAAGTNFTQDDLGLAVANGAVAGDLARIAKVTASSASILGPIVAVGLDDSRGQSIGVGLPGEICDVVVGETITPGTTAPCLTAGANSRWVVADPGEFYAVRLLLDGRAVLSAGDRAKAVVVHGQVDTP